MPYARAKSVLRPAKSAGAGCRTKKPWPLLPCGAALIRDGRRFLISQRRADDSFGSFWEFPGGRRDGGETFEECVRRECREELDIEVAVEKKFIELRRRFHGRTVWLNFFLCAVRSGRPRPLASQKIAWVDVDRLAEFRFPPANRGVIEKLRRLYGGSHA